MSTEMLADEAEGAARGVNICNLVHINPTDPRGSLHMDAMRAEMAPLEGNPLIKGLT